MRDILQSPNPHGLVLFRLNLATPEHWCTACDGLAYFADQMASASSAITDWKGCWLSQSCIIKVLGYMTAPFDTIRLNQRVFYVVGKKKKKKGITTTPVQVRIDKSIFRYSNTILEKIIWTAFIFFMAEKI